MRIARRPTKKYPDQAGGAGSSFSGFAFGGNGDGHGPGGNAYTGSTGASRGGNVVNTSQDSETAGDGDAIENTTASKSFAFATTCLTLIQRHRQRWWRWVLGERQRPGW